MRAFRSRSFAGCRDITDFYMTCCRRIFTESLRASWRSCGISTASQIRQDLNCFGGFGQQGYGYNVDALYEEIGNILGLNRGLKIILLGAGNLGMALVKHLSFEAKGFRLIGIFDKNPRLIGQKIHGVEILPESALESFCREHKPGAAILCCQRDGGGAGRPA